MTKSEAGKLGAIQRNKQVIVDYQARLAKYTRSPILCKQCGFPLSYDDFLRKKMFCNQSCRASFCNKGVRRHGQAKIEKKCLVCQGPTFRKFCSNKCSARHQRLRVFALIDSGTYKSIGPNTLRAYLIEKRGRQCEKCKNTHWFSIPIPLNVHHKDGRSDNNELKNLELLCLNCHGITETYGGKNRGNGRLWRKLIDRKNAARVAL